MVSKESVTSDSGSKRLKLDQHQEEWLKQLINKGTDQLTSLKHILSVYNQFWLSIVEHNQAMDADQKALEEQKLKEQEEQKQKSEEEKKIEPGAADSIENSSQPKDEEKPIEEQLNASQK